MKARHVLIAAAATAVIGGGGIAVAQATDNPEDGQRAAAERSEDHGSDRDELVTGADADRARSAAVKAANGGKAGDVERESDGGARYEVDVTHPDGKVTEVELDGDLGVVSTETESAADGDDCDDGKPGDANEKTR